MGRVYALLEQQLMNMEFVNGSQFALFIVFSHLKLGVVYAFPVISIKDADVFHNKFAKTTVILKVDSATAMTATI
jgi:hypothetical protein